jgi:hypothetical protein
MELNDEDDIGNGFKFQRLVKQERLASVRELLQDDNASEIG